MRLPLLLIIGLASIRISHSEDLASPSPSLVYQHHGPKKNFQAKGKKFLSLKPSSFSFGSVKSFSFDPKTVKLNPVPSQAPQKKVGQTTVHANSYKASPPSQSAAKTQVYANSAQVQSPAQKSGKPQHQDSNSAGSSSPFKKSMKSAVGTAVVSIVGSTQQKPQTSTLTPTPTPTPTTILTITSESANPTNYINGPNNKVKGQHNVIDGQQNDIQGDLNGVMGSANDVQGNINYVQGSNNQVIGNSNKVIGC